VWGLRRTPVVDSEPRHPAIGHLGRHPSVVEIDTAEDHPAAVQVQPGRPGG
jgi:hypothetical protein